MKIGYVQFDPQFGEKSKNIAKIKELVENAKADLLVLPEMCITGYMVSSREELLSLAEPLNGNSVKELICIAKDNNACLIFGMPELRDGKVFSSAIAVGPEGVITRHQKSHLFLKEKLLFDIGMTKPTLFEWRGVRIGLGVCYDYMFPEYWRSLALEGADIFCNTANFVFDYGFTMMRARSIENGVFSIIVNRIGKERGQIFQGGSEIIDNRGATLSKADTAEAVVVIDVDIERSRNKKWNQYNDLFKDRRIDLYN